MIPEVEQIPRFWRHLFAGERGLLQIWTGVRDSDSKIPPETVVYKNFNYPSEAENAATWALDKAGEGREVYFCAHLLTTPRRIKENAAPVRTLWGDLDGASVPNGALKPTAVVESSPGRYHAYWRLDTEIPPETAENLTERIAAKIGADSSGFDLTQLLRVPGTPNHKPEYEGTPVVQIRELDAERCFSAADLDKLLPASEKPKAGYQPNNGGGEEEPPVSLSPEPLKVWRGEAPKLKDDGETDRSGTLMKIGRALYDAGANRVVVVESLRERDATLGYRKYSGNRDGGQREYERIYEKLAAEGRRKSSGRIAETVGNDQPDEEPAKRRNQADRLIDYALESGAERFVDQMGAPHVLVDGEALPLNTGAYKWLRGLMWDREGISVSGEAIKTVTGTLAAFAFREGKVRELHTRSAFHEGAVYYWLGKRRVVQIDRDGWRVIEKPPVVFRSVPNLKPLPDPERGGTLDAILELVNLKTDRDKRLFKAYAATLALPHVARPILSVTGAKGSGKTTVSRLIKRMFDPTAPETVRIDPREFLQKASHCYIVMLDNQNNLPEWAVDTLCRLVTGEGDSKRSLYTDDEDVIYEMRRAILLNGINPPTDRGDAQDRTLPVELDRIPDRERRSEKDLWERFKAVHGQLLGAAFDALAGAIRARETQKFYERPRLADWGEYAAGVYEVMGWGVGQFLEDWGEVVKAQNQHTLDGSLVAQVIVAFMQNRGDYEGLASDLHAKLEARAEELNIDVKRDKAWPKSSSWLWRRMKDVLEVLAAMGVIASNRPGEAGSIISLKKDPLGPPDPGSSREKCFQESPSASRMLPGGMADTYAKSGSTGSTGSKYGHSSGSLSQTEEGERTETGRETPTARKVPGNASSASSITLSVADGGPVAAYLVEPHEDLLLDAEKCAREGGVESRLFKPLVSSVAFEVYGTAAGRYAEARPAVEAWVRELQERARDA